VISRYSTDGSSSPDERPVLLRRPAAASDSRPVGIILVRAFFLGLCGRRAPPLGPAGSRLVGRISAGADAAVVEPRRRRDDVTCDVISGTCSAVGPALTAVACSTASRDSLQLNPDAVPGTDLLIIQ